jgi:hypothetical protein
MVSTDYQEYFRPYLRRDHSLWLGAYFLGVQLVRCVFPKRTVRLIRSSVPAFFTLFFSILHLFNLSIKLLLLYLFVGRFSNSLSLGFALSHGLRDSSSYLLFELIGHLLLALDSSAICPTVLRVMGLGGGVGAETTTGGVPDRVLGAGEAKDSADS